MTSSKEKATRVFVDYSQFWVAGGPDVTIGVEIVPHLLLDLGPQAVAVLTGLHSGTLTVTARTLPAAPIEVDSTWDVAAETDLESADGELWVSGWGGHSFHRFTGPVGPGRYRLRVQARHRRQAEQERTDEQYALLAWPASTATPARLLTPMDSFGRLLDGERPPSEPEPDDLDLAAAQAVRQLAGLVAQPDPPAFSGELRTISARTVAPGTPRAVWRWVASPWNWVTMGGGTDPADFHVVISQKPRLTAEGGITASQPYSQVAFTWSWVSFEGSGSRRLPAEPGVVSIRLQRQGKGLTAVELQHRLPAELADTAQTYWDWALRELHRRLRNGPFYGYPWVR